MNKFYKILNAGEGQILKGDYSTAKEALEEAKSLANDDSTNVYFVLGSEYLVESAPQATKLHDKPAGTT